jgi:branched-chain amino acid transport system permease protein
VIDAGEKTNLEHGLSPGSPRVYVPVILVAMLFAVPLLFRSPIFLHLMVLIFFYAYLNLSWNILGGFAGQLSLGHAAFAGLGAYTSTLLFIHLGLTPWIGMFIGGVVASIVAVTIGYPCFKLRGAYFSLSTLAFGEILRLVIENTNEIFGIEIKGPMGISLPPLGHSPWNYQFLRKEYYYYIILVMMLLVLYFTYRLSKSKLGYYLNAIKNDLEAAQSLGVNVARCRVIAAMLSAFLTGIGGTFYAQLILFIDPAGIMSGYFSLEIVMISIIGGRGTLLGPVFGAFLLIPISELTRIYLGGTYMGVHLIIFGAALIVVIRFLPRGINELIMKGYSMLLGRLEGQRVRSEA